MTRWLRGCLIVPAMIALLLLFLAAIVGAAVIAGRGWP